MVGLFALLYVGCSNDSNNQTPSASSVTGFSGAGGGVGTACRNGFPDGICEPTESCECSECAFSDKCLGTCADNGMCECDVNGDGECDRADNDPDNGGPATEDCSCNDCFQVVDGCFGGDRGCNTEAQNNGDPAQCDSNENCTCPDCRGVAQCESNCTDDGVCVPYYEGCTCADCANTTFCGGTGPASSSQSSSAAMSSSAAVGGSGGAGGAGGAGGN